MVTEFRTILPLKDQRAEIDHAMKILSMGSCFAQEMGQKLKSLKFRSLVNPFGVIYNPLSMAHLLQNGSADDLFPKDTIVTKEGVYFHLNAHSQVSGRTPEDLYSSLAEALSQTQGFLSDCDYVFLTWGSAFVYEWRDSSEVVANCHKQKNDLFTKRLLTPQEIVQVYRKLFGNHTEKRFILTVSPIRHLRDTLELNSVSKSVLRYATHQLVQEFEHVSYFPSYEIVLDDLRDYRFYKEDMLHPTPQAVDYIWDSFSRTCLTESALQLCKKWEKIQKSLRHKPFNDKSKTYLDFLEDLRSKLTHMPLDVQCELIELENKIKGLRSTLSEA